MKPNISISSKSHQKVSGNKLVTLKAISASATINKPKVRRNKR